jgi:hypothetical protein
MADLRNKLENQVEIFKNESGDIEVSVTLRDETVWLSLNQLAKVFDRDKSAISRHLSNIFREKELQQESVVAKFATTASDGKVYQVDYYNLDAIVSVGYRVNPYFLPLLAIISTASDKLTENGSIALGIEVNLPIYLR